MYLLFNFIILFVTNSFIFFEKSNEGSKIVIELHPPNISDIIVILIVFHFEKSDKLVNELES